MQLLSVLGYVLVAVVGVAVGWLVCAMVMRRAEAEREQAWRQPTVTDHVLAAAEAGYVVIGENRRVLLSNGRAEELGVLRHGVPIVEVVDAAEQVAILDEPVHLTIKDLEAAQAFGHPRGPARTVQVTACPFREGSVLVTAHDDTTTTKVESVRRDFLANVSHELKTPVGAISLLSEAAADGADDPDAVRGFAVQLAKESARLSALVNELITLSRLESADTVPELAAVEIDGVIDETLNRVRTAASMGGIDLASDPRSGLLVRGDRGMLVTALTNLVDNAVHYSPSGTQVSVSRSRRAGVVTISVTDRGVGIPVELQERVFERFFRVDPARSRITGGTGLGLSIVKHIANAHGGRVTLWSRPGTGSTFSLELTALDRTPAEANRPSTGTRQPRGGSDRPSGDLAGSRSRGAQ
ncbi:sensor histidine kinase [Nakamurella leprariae]|uniref:Sensor-like histidine kinase SenX3 n=1 Tax=Nakamurella leprariae TaxID=2803911 RepID=A0A939BXZ4_9ACTN|nr:ATP-binding protein [Nakamurella leprariae]MBM9466525.1 two-component sensor histidine kinase [Nakamurella leprariae]